MERMAVAGHVVTFLADGVIGALCGAAVLGFSCSCLLPLAGYALAPARKPVSGAGRGGLPCLAGLVGVGVGLWVRQA